jgi:cellulose synthase/poly-beta-1,6-N-acetylglucosamine synthase-like glycosyltransferase
MPLSSTGLASASAHLCVRTPETIAVLIASYRRVNFLIPCLRFLEDQRRLPDEVIVVVRSDDLESIGAMDGLHLSYPLRIVQVSAPGTVAARNAGLDACQSDVVAILDDDTRPYPQWLDIVMRRFVEDPALGGLGGRDRCFDGETFDDRQHDVVGKIEWAGRMIGNHHLGHGGIREVDFLKGANMSFRSEALKATRFDPRLKGRGAQPGEDVAFSVRVKSRGWKLAYDPEAMIDHLVGRREEARLYVGVHALKEKTPFREFSYNEAIAVWEALSPTRRAAFIAWSFLIGTGTCPGIIQAVRFTPKLGRESWTRFVVAQQGKFAAFRDLLFGQSARA